jgi:virulence factor Mce-like protein
MSTRGPTRLHLAVMAGFALSCFGLLLFLWISFGGPVALKPEGYRFRVAFPSATQLALQADVRMAGVSVGKVVAKRLDPEANRTLTTIELRTPAAPLSSASRAILRQKTLLGETYVELTPGRPGAPRLPEGGRLADGRVRPTVQLDDIFTALDPRTREAFRTWQQELARGIDGRGRDLNAAFGNLPGFAIEAGGAVHTLRTTGRSLHNLVAAGGEVFGALTRDERALRGLIVNGQSVFGATAAQHRALAETFAIFPTFLDETKATLARLRSFAVAARPLMRDLRPAVHDLPPTVRSVRALAPDLRRTLSDLDPLIVASRTGLPALSDTLRGARPLLSSLGPFLAQLNPILQWLELYQHQVADFIGTGGRAIAARAKSVSGGTGHYLRQLTLVGPETVALQTRRTANNRGNAYLGPLAAFSPEAQRRGIFGNWDCKPSGGEVAASDEQPACFVQPTVRFQGLSTRFPHVRAAG